MDILDTAQKKINDAAGQLDTPPAEPTPSPVVNSSKPELSESEPPKELKEEAILPELPLNTPATTAEPPKSDAAKNPNPLETTLSETPPPESPQAFTPSVPEPESKSPEPLETTTFGGHPVTENKPEKPKTKATEAQPFVPPGTAKKIGGNRTALLLGLFILLVTLPIGIYFISQQQKALTEQRSKAGQESCGWCASQPQCPHGTTATSVCSNGQCCEGYSAGGGGGAPAPAPAPKCGGASNCSTKCANGQSFSDACPGGGSFSSCTQWANQACSSRGGVAGAASTTTTTGGGSTVGLPDSQNSGCCTTNTECITWFGSVSTCSNPNGACASGKQCKGGGGTGCHSCLQTDCGVAGCGGQTCNAGCPTKCGNGVCENGETYANCPADCKAPVATTGCGANGASCCDPFSTGGKICNSNLYCNTATGKCQTTPPGNLCQSGATAGTNCAVFTCGTRCNNGNQCNLNEQIVSCASASLGGQCGQIDFLDTTNGYCGVQSQNCGGSCVGGAPPAPPSGPSGPAPTPTPALAQCVRVKVYQGTAQIDPTTLKAGDSVTLAVNSTNATKGRIRVNGGAFTETITKNTNGEFTVPFTVPSGVTTFTVEAEVLSANGTWQ